MAHNQIPKERIEKLQHELHELHRMYAESLIEMWYSGAKGYEILECERYLVFNLQISDEWGTRIQIDLLPHEVRRAVKYNMPIEIYLAWIHEKYNYLRGGREKLTTFTQFTDFYNEQITILHNEIFKCINNQ